MEETCRSMNWIISKGYAFYWGTSEWTSSQINEAYTICERLNLIKLIVEQCRYNILFRESIESDCRDLFKKFKMKTTIWSPLYSGILNGKYIESVPQHSRAKLKNDRAYTAFGYYMKNKNEIDEKLLKIKEIAEKNSNVIWQLLLFHGVLLILMLVFVSLEQLNQVN